MKFLKKLDGKIVRMENDYSSIDVTNYVPCELEIEYDQIERATQTVEHSNLKPFEMANNLFGICNVLH